MLQYKNLSGNICKRVAFSEHHLICYKCHPRNSQNSAARNQLFKALHQPLKINNTSSFLCDNSPADFHKAPAGSTGSLSSRIMTKKRDSKDFQPGHPTGWDDACCTAELNVPFLAMLPTWDCTVGARPQDYKETNNKILVLKNPEHTATGWAMNSNTPFKSESIDLFIRIWRNVTVLVDSWSALGYFPFCCMHPLILSCLVKNKTEVKKKKSLACTFVSGRTQNIHQLSCLKNWFIKVSYPKVSFNNAGIFKFNLSNQVSFILLFPIKTIISTFILDSLFHWKEFNWSCRVPPWAQLGGLVSKFSSASKATLHCSQDLKKKKTTYFLLLTSTPKMTHFEQDNTECIY